MKLLSLSKTNPTTATTTTTSLVRSSSWPWRPYCHQPKTLSFRGGDDLFRTVNSTFLDSSPPEPPEEETEEGYANGNNGDDVSIETVIRGARSAGRIFFEPAGETSSVLAAESEDGASGDDGALEESGPDGVAMCVVDSRDPYGDFRTSMEEMVEAHALRDNWDSLEDLLHCYLRVNDRTNHGYILRAFVDLLLSSGSRRTRATLTDVSDRRCNWDSTNGSSSCRDNINNNAISHPSTSSSPCSPLSFYTSSSSCCSSTDSLSTTPCCVSIVEEAEENSCENGNRGTRQKKQCLPSTKKVAEHNINGERDESSSSSLSS